MKNPLLVGAIAILALSFCHDSSTAQMTLMRGMESGGGGTATSSDYTVRYSLGQNVSGDATSSDHDVVGGFWPPLPEGLTGVGDDEVPGIPDRFRLYQNIPNPFNPATAIRFDVPASGGHVRLCIYDVSGRLVTTLVNEPQTPGRKEIVWRGVDSAGQPVSSGIYIYRLQAPAYVESRKLALLR